MSNKNSSLKTLGIVMIVYGVLYALVGTLAIAGLFQGLMPGQESGEVFITVLSYVVAVLAVICGFAAVRGSSGTARMLGIVFAIVGLVSLVYMQVSQDAFSFFDCLTMLLGVAIAFQAREK